MITATPPKSATAWHEKVSLPPLPGVTNAFYAKVESLIGNFGAKEIWIFGSCARGKPTRDSDVDFLLVREPVQASARPATEARLCVARSSGFLPCDMVVVSPSQLASHLRHPVGIYADLAQHGFRIYARQS